jgi:hypothetical protein
MSDHTTHYDWTDTTPGNRSYHVAHVRAAEEARALVGDGLSEDAALLAAMAEALHAVRTGTVTGQVPPPASGGNGSDGQPVVTLLYGDEVTAQLLTTGARVTKKSAPPPPPPPPPTGMTDLLRVTPTEVLFDRPSDGYVIRTFVGSRRRGHVYRRTTNAPGGIIDYASAAVVSNVGAGITVTASPFELDFTESTGGANDWAWRRSGWQMATAALDIVGVVAGLHTFTVTCNGEAVTVKVVVEPKSPVANFPVDLMDHEWVAPSGDARIFTPTNGEELYSHLQQVRLGDVVLLGPGVYHTNRATMAGGEGEFLLQNVLARSTPGTHKGWVHVRATDAALTAAGLNPGVPNQRLPRAVADLLPELRGQGITNTAALRCKATAKFVRFRGLQATIAGHGGTPAVVWLADRTNDYNPNEVPYTLGFWQVAARGRADWLPSEVFRGPVQAFVRDTSNGETRVTIATPNNLAAFTQRSAQRARIIRAGHPEFYDMANMPYAGFDNATSSGGDGRYVAWLKSAPTNNGNGTTTVTLFGAVDEGMLAGNGGDTLVVYSTDHQGDASKYERHDGSAYGPFNIVRGFLAQGGGHVISHCLVDRIGTVNSSDSAGVGVWAGSGPWHIGDNNLLGPITEATIFGGSSNDHPLTNMDDIHEVRNLYDTLGWVSKSRGGWYNIKNAIEGKAGRRRLVEQGVARYYGLGDLNQFGAALVIKSQLYSNQNVYKTGKSMQDTTVRDMLFDKVVSVAQLISVQPGDQGVVLAGEGSYGIHLVDILCTNMLRKGSNGAGGFGNTKTNGNFVFTFLQIGGDVADNNDVARRFNRFCVEFTTALTPWWGTGQQGRTDFYSAGETYGPTVLLVCAMKRIFHDAPVLRGNVALAGRRGGFASAIVQNDSSGDNNTAAMNIAAAGAGYTFQQNVWYHATNGALGTGFDGDRKLGAFDPADFTGSVDSTAPANYDLIAGRAPTTGYSTADAFGRVRTRPGADVARVFAATRYVTETGASA